MDGSELVWLIGSSDEKVVACGFQPGLVMVDESYRFCKELYNDHL